MSTLGLVIPCFNEADSIPVLLQKFSTVIHNNQISVVFVNNGSTDNTSEILDDLIPKYSFASRIDVAKNQGYGHGIFVGLNSLSTQFVGWSHADLQSDPADIVKAYLLLKRLSFPSRTFIKGFRRGRPIFDQFFTFGMSILESIVLRYILRDINAQPTIFSRELFDKWSDPPSDFSIDLYYFYMAKVENYRCLRFNVLFPPRFAGKSSWNTGFISRVKFIKRTLKFTLTLKTKIKHELCK